MADMIDVRGNPVGEDSPEEHEVPDRFSLSSWREGATLFVDIKRDSYHVVVQPDCYEEELTALLDTCQSMGLVTVEDGTEWFEEGATHIELELVP